MLRQMTLTDAPIRSALVMGAGDVSDGTWRRLSTLGLRPGVTFRVLGKTVGGGRVAQVGETRVALGAPLCRELRVEVPSA